MSFFNLLNLLTVCKICIISKENQQNFVYNLDTPFLLKNHSYRYLIIYLYIYYLNILNILHTTNDFNKLQKGFAYIVPAYFLEMLAYKQFGVPGWGLFLVWTADKKRKEKR